MIKKIYLSSSIVLLTNFLYAQNVGINIEEPERVLDINGSLRVTKMIDKSNNVTSEKLLAVNRDNGNVDYIDISALQQSNKNNMEISRIIYNATDADINKECECGEISMRFNNQLAEFKLKSKEIFESNNFSEFNLVYGIKRFKGTSYEYKNKSAVKFQITNPSLSTFYNKYQLLDGDVFENNTIRIYTIVFPKQANMYRLTLSRFNNSDVKKTFGLICEKFYLQNVE